MMLAAIMFRVAIVLLAFASSLAAHASEKRVALVIGNSSYKSAPALDNTLHDAELISNALKSVGFEVLDGRNLSRDGMGKMLGRFAKMVQGADAGLVYYAGHSLQFDGENYLLPVDAEIVDEFGLRFEATRLEDIISTLRYSGGVQILVLDACRNNPFLSRLGRKGTTRGVEVRRGLAPVARSQGMLIAYATQSNDVATDGEGRNSPFTEALAREIAKPGQEIATLFRNVQMQVYAATKGQQLPELSVSLLGEFYLNTGETDLDAWKKLSLSDDRAQLEAFIKKYPDSGWVTAAKMRLSDLAEKALFLQEFAQRERAIKELNQRAEQLETKIKEAQKRRDEAKEQLASRAEASSPPPSVGKNDSNKVEPELSKSERERLAATVQEQQSLVLTFSAERQRIEAEKKAAEQTSNERLQTQTWVPDAGPPQEKSASGNMTGAAFPQMPPYAGPLANAQKTAASKCADILARLQLGEQSQSDLNALKQCER